MWLVCAGELRDPIVKPEVKRILGAFAIELVVYGVLVALFLYFLLPPLGEWFVRIHKENRQFYALMALVAVITQVVVLDLLTRLLLRCLGRSRKD